MALNKDQKKFIRKKVRSLGSRKNVREFYTRKSLVCEYAHKIARKIYKRRKNVERN